MLRYVRKQFETEEGQRYRPFLKGEWKKKECQDMFFVNLGKVFPEKTERELKLAESMAHQLGKKQIVAELPEPVAQEERERKKRRTAGFYYVNGVNRICVEEPVEEEKDRYYMQLGYFLGEGALEVRTALFEPDEDICRTFSKHGIPFHILTDSGMTKYGFTEGKSIGCGKCTYDYLVLPADVVLSEVTADCISTFYGNGGQLLFLEAADASVGRTAAISGLQSSCTFGQIARSQIYLCKNTETEIYSTYRRLNQMELLYVVNASLHKTYAQTFDFGEKVHSFLKLDLLDFTTESLPLTVTLKPGEELLLIPYAKKL